MLSTCCRKKSVRMSTYARQSRAVHPALRCGPTLCCRPFAEGLNTSPLHKLQLMKAIAYLETETVLVEDTAAQHLGSASGKAGAADTARVAAENERMRAELAAG